MSTAKIRQPWDDDLTENDREKIRAYYKNEIGDDQIIQNIYGGEPLQDRYYEMSLNIRSTSKLSVSIELFGDDFDDNIRLSGINFRQLLVQSSGPGSTNENSPNFGWKSLADPQRRIEICENELHRWSIHFKREEGWNGARITAPDDISVITLTNNCTTSEGFEIFLKTDSGNLHGSVIIPQDEYRFLSQLQAGAWASQGWNSVLNSDQLYYPNEKGYNKVGKINFGSGLYKAPKHAVEDVTIDLDRYRTRTRLMIETEITQDLGVIDYRQWGVNEYWQKPHVRLLVSDIEKDEYSTPPKTYKEVQSPNPTFRLPDFWPQGLYRVDQPTEKTHYNQLSDLSVARIWETKSGLHELEIISPNAKGLDLKRIVIGNINLMGLKTTEFTTIHRFGFSPRPTNASYDKDWLPAYMKEGGIESALYAWLLAPYEDDENIGTFIQSENWGIERAILSYTDETRSALIVDLISFERIVPVWRGTMSISGIVNQNLA